MKLFACLAFLLIALPSHASELDKLMKGLSRITGTQFSDPQSDGFTPHLVYLLDKKGDTYLFRGNLPESDESFCYTDLIQTFNSYTTSPLSSNVQLLDLSFLNYIAEDAEIKIEKNWFKKNPSLGQFQLHPLYGALINPCDLPSELREFVCNHHDVDGQKALMSRLKKEMEKPRSTDFVIYIHCQAGKDRTGEASACYLMQYKSYSYNDAVQLGQQIADRPMREMSMNAIRWYAFYLRDNLKIATIGSIEGK